MTLLFRRKISYHLLQTYLPSGLFVIVAWLSLFLPPESIPGRITMAMTTLLTLAAMFGAVRYVAAGQINTFSLYILSKCNSVLNRSISAVFEALAVLESFSTLIFFSISVRKWHFSITHIWVSLQSAVIYFFCISFSHYSKIQIFCQKFQV